MNWQEITALGIVAVTAGLFLWRVVRRRKFNFTRDTHCGCSSAQSAPAGSIVFHARRGEQPQIIVKPK